MKHDTVVQHNPLNMHLFLLFVLCFVTASISVDYPLILPLFTWMYLSTPLSLQWRHNEHDGVSNHQPRDCLLNRLFRRRLKKTSKLRVTGSCAGNSPVTGEFPAQRASNVKNASISWRHNDPDAGSANICL